MTSSQEGAKQMRYWIKCAAAAVVVGLVAYNGGRLSAHVGGSEAAATEHVSLAGANASAQSPVETMSDIATTVGADRLWAGHVTGSGVDVAVIDSGVTPVGALAAPGKVVYGPDFSGDATNPDAANLDLLGHGTHMAGIIAGNGDGDYTGIAPDARIVSVKVADPDGTTDVTRVLQAIMWVVDHKDDAGLHIRVMNVSLGGLTKQPYDKSLLSAAVERAWQAGITVVAAAGNEGSTSQQLSDPAYDPYVIAVGAVDTAGTISTDDDKVASFSSKGSGTRSADLMAPGVRVQGLRVPGSLIDDEAPSATGSPFVNGSGTSQATAVVSGAVALLVQQHPEYTPDDLKSALVSTAVSLRQRSKNQGTSELQLAKPGVADTAGATAGKGSEQHWKTATVTDAQLASASASAVSSDGVRWNGVRWNGVRWNGVRWNGVRWNGSSWD